MKLVIMTQERASYTLKNYSFNKKNRKAIVDDETASYLESLGGFAVISLNDKSNDNENINEEIKEALDDKVENTEDETIEEDPEDEEEEKKVKKKKKTSK